MAKIKSITLKNIKFFGESQTINLDGKHTLVYGENGSGKSSLYWALYRILASSNKIETAEIEKYFVPNGEYSWLNANEVAAGNLYAEISLNLDDESTFTLTNTDFSINQNQNAKESNMASEFLSYKFLYKLLDFTVSEDIDLFKVFHQQLLPYIPFQSVTYWRENRTTGIVEDYEANNALQIYNFVKNGPQKIYPNRNAELRYPSKNTQPFITYKDIVDGFESSMKNILNLINAIGNPILKDDLGYDIRFQINFVVDNQYELTSTNFVPPKYRIELKIPYYEGLTDVVKKPHAFLNEAKLTAVGLAIRLAVLQQRLQKAKLKLLVIDDLLLSLDMSNRDKVIGLILGKYALDYQIFFLTHDRALFEKSKRLIKIISNPDDWKYLEMYVDNRNIPSKPYIKKSESFIENAYSFLHQFEYPAAANSLRKASEELLIELLPLTYRLTDDCTPIIFLDNLLAKAESYYKSLPIDYKCISDMREFVKTLMNPLSHSDLSTPVYREELKQAFDCYEKIMQFKNLKQFVYLQKGTKLSFELIDQSNHNLKFEIELKEDLRMNYISGTKFKLGFCKFKVNYTENGDSKEPLFPKHKSIEKFYLDACKQTGNAPLDINKDVIFNSWPNLTQLLQQHGFIK